MGTQFDINDPRCDPDTFRETHAAPSSCTVDSIVVPRDLWERTVRVIETIYNSRRGSCGAIENVYCPPMMNRHGIDNLMNEIRRHNARSQALRGKEVKHDKTR
jgi:hypothetical protein